MNKNSQKRKREHEIFRIIHFFILSLLFLYLFLAKSVHASAEASSTIQLQVPIFGYTQATNFASYLGQIYTVALYIIIPFAIVVIIFSGVLWIMSGGDRGLIAKAKDRIIYAFIGLGLAMGSYLILSFFNLTTLSMPEVEYISPVSGDLLMVTDANGVSNTYTLAEGENKLPSGRKGSAADFQSRGCPKGQSSFEVFFTYYYKPPYGSPGGPIEVGGKKYNLPKYESWECNIGMQCTCPLNGPGEAGSCRSHGNRCKPFGPEVSYCNSTGGNKKKPPIGGYTIAADVKPRSGHNGCFKRGCKIMIEGKGPYEIHDAGSLDKIVGLHMDYFVDFQTGRGLPPPQGVYKVDIIDQASCF